MWQQLGPWALAAAMVAGLWLSLQRGWLYTRRSYLDLLSSLNDRIKDKDARIADLKESNALLRDTVKEREQQVATLLGGRRAES